MTRKLPLLLLGIICFLPVRAQERWDFRTWHRLKAGGEIAKDLKLSIEGQVRLDDNSTQVKKTFTELGIGYDLPKGFGLDAAYRVSLRPLTAGESRTDHRYNIDISYSRRIRKLKTKMRARFQHRPSAPAINERLEPDDSPMLVRLKFRVAYAGFKKWDPGVEFEMFFPANDPTLSGISRFRYRAFLNHDLSKRQELGLFYMLQTDYSGDFPEFASVVGISYAYRWKRPKKKKKKKDGD